MIPKIIHYCWFGNGKKTSSIERCIESWKKYAPGFEICEWNESNVDIQSHSYMRDAYAAKKWAYVSDYARLIALRDVGGIYLDTDMLLLRDITPLTADVFIGKEDPEHISAGIIGVTTQHPFIRAVLTRYDTLTKRVPIPVILSEVYNQEVYDMRVYDPVYFYPFDSHTIKSFDGTNAPRESYAVHLWDYSWGNPVVRVAKSLGVYNMLKYIVEHAHVKHMLKRLMGME